MRLINLIAFIIGLISIPLFNAGFAWTFDEMPLGIPLMLLALALPAMYILFVAFIHVVKGTMDETAKYHFRLSLAFLFTGFVAGVILVRIFA